VSSSLDADPRWHTKALWSGHFEGVPTQEVFAYREPLSTDLQVHQSNRRTTLALAAHTPGLPAAGRGRERGATRAARRTREPINTSSDEAPKT